MTSPLSEADWEMLLDLIQQGKCTPFIGAGACAEILPTATELAQEWAAKYEYPLPDTSDLARVAQFLAISRYPMFPKVRIQARFQGKGPPDFSSRDEPHALLADLNLPIYITTNYDDFMVQALRSRKREPVREFCRWNNYPEVTGQKSALRPGYKPRSAQPLVYHLHGHLDVPQSMVLTEGDYLDFLIRLSGCQDHLLPPPILQALAGTALLFVGYSLTDYNFRVIFRGLVGSLGASLGYLGLAVQLPPGYLDPVAQEKARSYLSQYFAQIPQINVRIYWGSAREFAKELRERLGAQDHGQ